MKTVQLKKQKNNDWEYLTPKIKLKNPLVLVFGDRLMLEDIKIYKSVKKLFPNSDIVFASTCGDMMSSTIENNCLSITAIELEKSTFKVQAANLSQTNLNSYDLGVNLVNQLKSEKLKYILVLSNGSFVNGSDLLRGMNENIDNNVLITGGLCGDDERFERTLVSHNQIPKDGEIVAIGFYGDTFEVTSSVSRGWQPFGPERLVTKAKGNILYELDNKPALDLYKKYLGEKSSELPLAAMYYPLKVKPQDDDHYYVRTILNINKEYNAMIFAGDVPLNSKVQLMMTNIDRLIIASKKATNRALEEKHEKTELAFMVSGFGRKIILEQRAIEEVNEARSLLGNNTTICSFYSYGEIAPFEDESMCQLHNQSIAITLISE